MSKIRARREALQVAFSQHHLAKLTKIPQTKISLIERELVNPTPEERERIARALQCPATDLWPEAESMEVRG